MTRMQDEANQLGRDRDRRRPPRGEVAPVGQPHHRVPLPRHRGGQELRRGDPARTDHHHLPRQLMTVPAEAPGDLPEAAARRFAEGPSPPVSPCPTSPPACRWAWSRSATSRASASCSGSGTGWAPRSGPSADRRLRAATAVRTRRHGSARTVSSRPNTVRWGQNFEQPWIESAWSNGFGTAYSRMLEEAAAVGAHGVVGRARLRRAPGDMGVVEFRLRGTAVR